MKRLSFTLVVLVAVIMTGTLLLGAQEEPLRIGYVLHVTGNPFIQQIHAHALQAARDLGVEVITAGPQAFDAEAQLKDVQDLFAAGVDGVITSVPGESMVRALNDFVEEGKPMIQVNISSQNFNALHIGERPIESGRILGRMVLEQIGGAEATGKVLLGICAPGLPLLENRGIGVKESLAAAPGLEVLGPFDVKDDATENFANWERLYAANPDAVAMIGLCAPDLTSLGRLNAQFGDAFVAGGYDLTPSNLQAIADGHAYVTMGQTPFVQGYLAVKIMVEHLRDGAPLEAGFIDTGTSVVTRDSVQLPYGLPDISFDRLLELESDPELAYEFYKPLIEPAPLADWQAVVEPLENELQ